MITKIRNYLEQNTGIKTFISFIPAEDDGEMSELYAVSEYASAFGGDTNTGYVCRSISITARGNNFLRAREMAESAFELFDSGDEKEIYLEENVKIIGRPKNPPLFLKYDEKNRALFVLNIVVHGN